MIRLPNFELRYHPKERVDLVNLEGVKNIMYYSNPADYIYKGESFTLITYYFFYGENMALTCFGGCFPNSKRLGYHKNDVERVSILYDQMGSPQYVYFFAHSKGQGMWLPWSKCEKFGDDGLVIYVALNSHASYPRPKTYVRVFGFANDKCSNKGKVVRPIYQPSNETTNYMKITEVPTKPPQTSITTFQRFMLPFYVDKLKLDS